jgi:hypothetical protein
MPTSIDEARRITNIINTYVSTDQARIIATRLEEEVGRTTQNESLRISLGMLRELYEKNHIISVTHRIAWASLIIVVGFHMLVIMGMAVSFFTIPFYTPWYISIPLETLIINLLFSPVSCPLTRLESRLRRSLGLPEVRFFVRYYFFRPTCRAAAFTWQKIPRRSNGQLAG